MTKNVYGGGGTRSRHWGKDENEKGYGTKLSGGTHKVNYTDDGYTMGRDKKEMLFNHRYQKQFRGRYMVRMGKQMTKDIKTRKGI